MRRDDRDLRGVDRSLRSRRLPHRHGAPRECRILAGVRACDARAGAGEGHSELPHLRRSRDDDNGQPAHSSPMHTRVDKLPSVLDFAFARAAIKTVAGECGHRRAGESCSRRHRCTKAERQAALRLPTFLGNHDAGRFSTVHAQGVPKASDDEMLKRDAARPCHAADRCAACRRSITATSRASSATAATRTRARTCSRRRSRSTTTMSLIGVERDHGAAEFRYRSSALQVDRESCRAMRTAQAPRLRTGSRLFGQARTSPGLFAVSRFDPASGREMLVAVQHVR